MAVREGIKEIFEAYHMTNRIKGIINFVDREKNI